jgi:hypothetical protein
MVIIGYVAMVLETDNCRWAGAPFPSIAPNEGISPQFEVKRPGPVVDLAAVKPGPSEADALLASDSQRWRSIGGTDAGTSS